MFDSFICHTGEGIKMGTVNICGGGGSGWTYVNCCFYLPQPFKKDSNTGVLGITPT